MSLLREIQDAAIDSNTNLASLLRRCKVLAARLGNEEFKAWVESELSGYNSIEELPDYRQLTVNSKGHFSGPFGSGIKNGDIPLGCIPKDFRESLQHAYLSMPISAMEALVSNKKNGVLHEPWNPDLVAHFGRDIYQNMNCVQAWKVIPTASVVAALDAVRTRILNFSLEIEAENPKAGEAQLNSNPIPQEKVQQIFNTYVTGNVQNMATGTSGNVTQKAKHTHSTDIETIHALLAAIQASSAPQASKDALGTHAEAMQDAIGTTGFKDHYLKFIGALADHMQVLGPVVAPYLPAIAAMLP